MFETTSRRAGVLLLISCGLTLAGCFVMVLASGVSTHLFRAPLSHDAFIAFAPYAAAIHLVTLAGLLRLRRSGVTGATRSLTAVAAGTALLFVCELASIPLVDSVESTPGAVVVDSGFGLATIVVAVGMIVAGRTSLRSHALAGWGRFAPLACGVLGLVVIPIQFTGLTWLGVSVYAIGYGALGAALVARRRAVASRPATA